MKNIDEFGLLALQRVVNKMFCGRCFSICDFDEMAKLSGKPVNHKIREQLRAYHCVDYSDMSDREKQLLQDKVVEAIRGDNILNPARVLNELTDEGSDFAFTEDRFIDSGNIKRLR